MPVAVCNVKSQNFATAGPGVGTNVLFDYTMASELWVKQLQVIDV